MKNLDEFLHLVVGKQRAIIVVPSLKDIPSSVKLLISKNKSMILGAYDAAPEGVYRDPNAPDYIRAGGFEANELYTFNVWPWHNSMQYLMTRLRGTSEKQIHVYIPERVNNREATRQ